VGVCGPASHGVAVIVSSWAFLFWFSGIWECTGVLGVIMSINMLTLDAGWSLCGPEAGDGEAGGDGVSSPKIGGNGSGDGDGDGPKSG
jgi:hypothetical protein